MDLGLAEHQRVASLLTKHGSRYDHSWLEVRDWVGMMEVKSGTGGWNVHEHLLIFGFGQRLDYAGWQRDWKRAANDPAAHIDLRQVGPAAVRYVTNYLSKGIWGGLTSIQARIHTTVLRGRRQLRRKRGSAVPPTPKGYQKCCTDRGSDGWNCVFDDFFGSASVDDK